MKKYFLFTIVFFSCSLQIKAVSEVCIDSLAENYYPYLDPASPFYDESLLSSLDVNNEVCTYTNSYHFNYDITDMNASVIFPNTMVSNLVIPDSSILGAFYYDNNGELKCGGAIIWNADQLNGISIWGDDVQFTSIKNGFSEDDPIEWKLVTPQGELFSVSVNYNFSSMGIGNSYNSGSSYVVSSVFLLYQDVNEYNTEMLDNSICINPNACNFSNETLDNFSTYSEGNCLFTPEACTLETNNPDSIKINLRPGWNTVSYYLPHPSSVLEQFESQFGSFMEVQENINIIKSNEGLFFWPDFGFDGIGQLLPGQGYQVRVKETPDGNSGKPDFIFDINIDSPGFDSYEEYISTPIMINLNTGWNLIGYQHFLPSSIQQQLIQNFGSIENVQNNIQIIKDNYGNFYWPDFNYSKLEYFTPGEGYFIKIKAGTPGLSNFHFINPVYGCIDSTATNFNNNATIHDSSCIYLETSICDSLLNTNQLEIDSLNDYIAYILDSAAISFAADELADAYEYTGLYWSMQSDYDAMYNHLMDSISFILDSAAISFSYDEMADAMELMDTIMSMQSNFDEMVYYFQMELMDTIMSMQSNFDEMVYYFQDNITLSTSYIAMLNDSISSIYESYDSSNYQHYQEVFIPLHIPEGWGMFGFTCVESMDAEDAFSPIVDKLIIVKDNDGNAYLPDFSFNGLGDLIYSRGYQIKTTEEILDFSFCPTLMPAVEGCMDSEACNYNSEVNTDDGSCTYAEQGYDCEGNLTAEIGDIVQGGMLFYIDETGQHGLVAAMEDLDAPIDPFSGSSGYIWGCLEEVYGADETYLGTGYQNTMDILAQECELENQSTTAALAASNTQLNGYNDWYLPSIDELIEMYNTIGHGAENIGNFNDSPYWSSSEYNSANAWRVLFGNYYLYVGTKGAQNQVRVIRAF